MTITQALLGFGVVAALVTIIPGIDTALVLRSTVRGGRRAGFAAALGINLGCLVWGLAAALGASALLAVSEVGYRALTLAGAAYLIVLGGRMLWSSLRSPGPGGPDAPGPGEQAGRVARPGRSFLMGFGTNLLNPKVGVFYLAAIPQFTPAGTSALLMGVLLALLHNAIGMVWFTGIILGVTRAGRWLRGGRALRIVDRVTGLALVGVGATVAIDAG